MGKRRDLAIRGARTHIKPWLHHLCVHVVRIDIENKPFSGFLQQFFKIPNLKFLLSGTFLSLLYIFFSNKL